MRVVILAGGLGTRLGEETGVRPKPMVGIGGSPIYIGNEPFLLTYGDGISDVNINERLDFHKKSGKLCTLMAVQPEGRFGVLKVEEDSTVSNFQEKPKNDDAWINGGFFVCEPKVFDYIPDGDDVIWEQVPLRTLSKDGQLNAYKYRGFWRSMDMLKDKEDLNKIWASGNAPWKVWKD